MRGIRLDQYIWENWPPPQFLKIDVEGGAGAVLRGARSLIAHHRPTIYLELHGPEEQEAVRELLTWGIRQTRLLVCRCRIPQPDGSTH